jgi:hypothetical protein
MALKRNTSKKRSAKTQHIMKTWSEISTKLKNRNAKNALHQKNAM